MTGMDPAAFAGTYTGGKCFDSYDYANETRYYRWFFIKEKGKLTRIYYADERNRIQVTEDVRNLENKCLEKMRKEGWIK